jgi:hypothetical protein
LGKLINGFLGSTESDGMVATGLSIRRAGLFDAGPAPSAFAVLAGELTDRFDAGLVLAVFAVFAALAGGTGCRAAGSAFFRVAVFLIMGCLFSAFFVLCFLLYIRPRIFVNFSRGSNGNFTPYPGQGSFATSSVPDRP